MSASCRSISRPASCLALALLILGSGSADAQTTGVQARSPFTIDDVLDVVSVDVGSLSDDGRWLAVTSTSLRDRIGVDNYRFGDPTYVAPSVADLVVIDTRSGSSRSVFGTKRDVRGLAWSPGGRRLAMVVREGEEFTLAIWDREASKARTLALSEGRSVSVPARGDVQIDWSDDGQTIFLPVHSAEWRRAARAEFEALTKGPITVLSSEEPFLRWEALRNASSVRALVSVDVETGRIGEVLAEAPVLSYGMTGDGDAVVYSEDLTEGTSYARDRSRNGRLVRRAMAGGPTHELIASTKGLRIVWSRDADSYAYSKDGGIFFGTIHDALPRQLTEAPEREEESDAEEDDVGAPRLTAEAVSPSGNHVVASSEKGLWLVSTQDGEKTLFLASSSDDDATPRYEVVDWSPGGDALFLSFQSRSKWERGLARYDVATGQMRELVKDDRLYSGFQLSKDGSTFVFNAAAPNRPADVHVADASFRNVRRVTNANPSLGGKSLGEPRLFSYLDVDGKQQKGVLYLPAGYRQGESYPTVFIVYESFFDPRFNGTVNFLTSHGYAVVQPSVDLEIGFPGEAWMKGVTAAANHLIEAGVADAERLGVHGTSYGGYAVNLLITQTKRFKAAINISGKVNMVSFYTDSPRLGIRNIHAPENSQDRLGATLWEQPQKYIAHSAVMFADRIETPLLVLTGEQDHNVPGRQGMEIYYALRRLGKTVEWVNYVNGGHGMPTSTVEEVRDYHERILGWYEKYLKPDPSEVAQRN